MTPERAREILASQRPLGEIPLAYVPSYKSKGSATDSNGVTEAEDAYVRSVWELMPGNTCWMDALRRIANGTAPAPATTTKKGAGA